MGWNKKPSELMEDVRTKHSQLAREAAMMVLRGVVVRSPVDTGRFRSNWQITEGRKASGEITEIQDAVAAGRAALETFNKDSLVLYVTNNLPYAEALEEGHSDFAPNGMVALTIVEVQYWLEKK